MKVIISIPVVVSQSPKPRGASKKRIGYGVSKYLIKMMGLWKVGPWHWSSIGLETTSWYLGLKDGDLGLCALVCWVKMQIPYRSLVHCWKWKRLQAARWEHRFWQECVLSRQSFLTHHPLPLPTAPLPTGSAEKNKLIFIHKEIIPVVLLLCSVSFSRLPRGRGGILWNVFSCDRGRHTNTPVLRLCQR